MIDLHVRVEEFADAMGAAGKDDFVGDAHDYLRGWDEKMPGHGEVARHGWGDAYCVVMRIDKYRWLKTPKAPMAKTAKGAFRGRDCRATTLSVYRAHSVAEDSCCHCGKGGRLKQGSVMPRRNF